MLSCFEFRGPESADIKLSRKYLVVIHHFNIICWYADNFMENSFDYELEPTSLIILSLACKRARQTAPSPLT